MAYDASHCTWNFWKMDSPFSVELIREYTLIILYYINFGLLCLTPTRNALHWKKLKRSIFIKKQVVTKTVIFMQTKEMHTLSTYYISLWQITRASLLYVEPNINFILPYGTVSASQALIIVYIHPSIHDWCGN